MTGPEIVADALVGAIILSMLSYGLVRVTGRVWRRLRNWWMKHRWNRDVDTFRYADLPPGVTFSRPG